MAQPLLCSPDMANQNEGEGSKSADKKYRDGVGEFLKEEDPEALARKALEDFDKNDPEDPLLKE